MAKHGEEKFTAAQVRFCQRHLKYFANGAYLDKHMSGYATWPFIDRCRSLGLVKIVDKHNRFPYHWDGTKLTEKGRKVAAAYEAK